MAAVCTTVETTLETLCQIAKVNFLIDFIRCVNKRLKLKLFSYLDEAIHLYRDVVLLTEDRHLRMKAHTRNVPVKNIIQFCKWANLSGGAKPAQMPPSSIATARVVKKP